MRRELARWQRSGLNLREFGQQHGIPLSTLTWLCLLKTPNAQTILEF
jgi:hypothetical protein